MSETLSLRTPGPVGQVADAIADRLKRVFPPAKFDHQFVPARLDETAWDTLLRRTPFVGIGFVNLEPKQASNTQFTGAAEFAVFLVTRNESGPYQRFFGDKIAPGVVQMMQVAIAALQGYRLKRDGMGLGTVSVMAAANSFADEWKSDTIAMIGLTLSIQLSFGVADVLEGGALTAATLDTTTIEWSFDGGGTFPLTDTTTGGA